MFIDPFHGVNILCFAVVFKKINFYACLFLYCKSSQLLYHVSNYNVESLNSFCSVYFYFKIQNREKVITKFLDTELVSNWFISVFSLCIDLFYDLFISELYLFFQEYGSNVCKCNHIENLKMLPTKNGSHLKIFLHCLCVLCDGKRLILWIRKPLL